VDRAGKVAIASLPEKTAAEENQRVERTAVTGACRSDSKKVLATYASPLGSKD